MKNPLILTAVIAAIALVASIAYIMSSNTSSTLAVGRLNASHILIQFNGSQRAKNVTRTKEEALDFARTVRDLAIKEGADFADLAKTHSDGPSASKGGDLGNFEPDGMIPAFSRATLELEIGEISEPVESQYGFHVILRKAVN